jgi:hypothetical protein
MIHIDTIYETEAFRLLNQGMKDKHAVGVVYTLMACNEDLAREFDRWCTERLQEQDDERAEWEARLSEEVQALVGNERKQFAEERAVWEAERSKQYKIGDVMAELVFKNNDIHNLSNLQHIFDITEKLLAETSLRLANETHHHDVTRNELLRVTETNKAVIHAFQQACEDLGNEVNKVAEAAREAGYVDGESPANVIKNLAGRVDRLKEEMALMDAQIKGREETIAGLREELASTGEISSRAYMNRMDVVHKRLFHDDPTDIPERRDRFLEEALELAQSLGMTTPYAHKLVDYVFGRPRSNSPENEIADVFTTLASLGIQMHMNIFNLGLRGLKRMEKDETIDRIRAKRKTRHGRGPLPGFDPTPVAGVAQHVQTVGRGLRQEVKEPATIGEVMRNRDFSTGEPGKVVTITSLAHRSIIGDNDGPWPLTGVRGEFATDDIPALAAEVTMERPHGFRWGVGQRVR